MLTDACILRGITRLCQPCTGSSPTDHGPHRVGGRARNPALAQCCPRVVTARLSCSSRPILAAELGHPAAASDRTPPAHSHTAKPNGVRPSRLRRGSRRIPEGKPTGNTKAFDVARGIPARAAPRILLGADLSEAERGESHRLSRVASVWAVMFPFPPAPSGISQALTGPRGGVLR